MNARTVEVALRDGSRVQLRSVLPTDKRLLASGFEHLSPESRYRRFLAPIHALSTAQLRYLTEVDHHDHEAIAALDPATGAGIGIARYVRLPDHPQLAETAVTVVDEWQGRGLGTLLLEALTERARQEGITGFRAALLAENHEMLELFERIAPVRVVDRAKGTVQVEFDLPPAGLSPQLRAALRASGVPAVRKHH